MNPELQRNLWLELTPGRLVGMTAILGAVLLLNLIDWPDRAEVLAGMASFLFFLLAGLWGTRRASACVPEEIAAGTWDAQRMSALSAWSFTWGKVLGSTAYVWFGALICLALAALGLSNTTETSELAMGLATLVAAALTGQLAAFCASLAAVRKNRDKRLSRVTLAQIIGLSVLLILPSTLSFLETEKLASSAPVSWYVLDISALSFQLTSALAFMGWGWVGAYRLIRQELQYRSLPWAWPLFVAFCMAYMGGFAYEMSKSPDLNALQVWSLAFMVGVFLTYVAAFAGTRDVVSARRLVDRVRSGDMRTAFSMLPLWLVTLPLVIVAGGAVVSKVNASSIPDVSTMLPLPGGYSFAPELWVMSIILFLVRDLLLAHLLGFLGRAGTKDLAWLVSLIFLYALLPGILTGLGATWSLSLFWPTLNSSSPGMVFAPMAEVVILAALLWMRLKALSPAP